MTQKDKIKYFDEIVKYSLSRPKPVGPDMGNFIDALFKEHNVIEEWEKQNDITRAKLSESDREVINAFLKGWTFHAIDGVIWYNQENKPTGGPFKMPRSPFVKIVSTRQFNKLIRLGWINTTGMDDPHRTFT